MKFLFRKKWKRGKAFTHKLPWLLVQSDLLEARLEGSRSSSRGSSRSNSPCPDADGGGGSGWAGAWVTVAVQVGLVLAVVALGAHLLLAALTALLAPPLTPRPRPLVPPAAALTLEPMSVSRLLGLPNFHFIHEASSQCASQRLFFLFLVHSRPDHFRQRQAIRATWGARTQLGGGWVTRTVFMLGRGGGGGPDEGVGGDQAQVEAQVAAEAAHHEDLVVGSFVDHYHNLTYKHVMALRWAAARCAHATFLVKADDDAFIDVVALHALLRRTFSLPPPPRTLACNVLPAGTSPQRQGKWAVSHADYPWPQYPAYCAGLAYVATPHVADLLSRVAESGAAPRVWVDDVWVTGLLAEALRLRHHYLNLRYTYDHNEVTSWAAAARPGAPPPYTFAHLDPACPDWLPTLRSLWHHALTRNTTQPS